MPEITIEAVTQNCPGCRESGKWFVELMKMEEIIMKVYIKNMVAQGTRKFVLIELKKLGLKLKSFEAGELEFRNNLSLSETIALGKSLSKYGLELSMEEVSPELQYSLSGTGNHLWYDEDYMIELEELHHAG